MVDVDRGAEQSGLEARVFEVTQQLRFDEPFFAGSNPIGVRRFQRAVGEATFDLEQRLGLPTLTFGIDWDLAQYQRFVSTYTFGTNHVMFEPDFSRDSIRHLSLTGAGAIRASYVDFAVRGAVAHEAYHAYVDKYGQGRLEQIRNSHKDMLKEAGRELDYYYDDIEQHNSDAYEYFYVLRHPVKSPVELAARMLVATADRINLRKFHRRGVHSTS